MTAVQKKKYLSWGAIATGVAILVGVFTTIDYSCKWANNISSSYREVYNIKEMVKEHVDIQRKDFDNVENRIMKVGEDMSTVKQEVARISGMLKVIIKSKEYTDNQRIEAVQNIEVKDKKEFSLYTPLTDSGKI